MDCSLPGSSAYGIFQARVQEWGAIAFSDNTVYFNKEKETVVHIYNGIPHSHKRNSFVSVLVMWINIEPIIQSEVSHKKKN